MLNNLNSHRIYRELCYRCFFSKTHCLCSEVKSFLSDPAITILIHPEERRKRIATARIAHLCLENSNFFEGVDFSQHQAINKILNDREVMACVLYPSAAAMEVAEFSRNVSKSDKKMMIFVPDGTWRTAKRLIHASENLRSLTHVTLTGSKTSNFIVRKQPKAHCLSTLEAIHAALSEIHPNDPKHEILMELQNKLVKRQLQYELTSLGTEEFSTRKSMHCISQFQLE